jgi:hypothetical protein
MQIPETDNRIMRMWMHILLILASIFSPLGATTIWRDDSGVA